MLNRFKAAAARNNPGVGVSQYTATQKFFIDTNAGGRWACSPFARTHTAANIRVNVDGTVDMIRLQAGLTGWQDLGGQGAYDVRAGRY